MKNILTAAILASAGAAITITTAQAQQIPFGDVALGFYASGGTGASESLLIDLGPEKTLANATAPISLGNYNSDLQIFGTSYQTRSDLFAGIIGTNTDESATTYNSDPAQTLYAGANKLGQGYLRQTVSTQLGNVGTVDTLFEDFSPKGGGATAANADVMQNSDGSSYGAQASLSAPFNQFGSSKFNVPYSTDGKTPANGQITLEYVPPGKGNPPATPLGTLSFDNAGDITFTPSAVPEPCSAVMVGMGLVGMLGFIRRRNPQA